MRQSAFLLFIILISCTSQRDRIIIPEISESFYTQALIRIDNDLKGNEDNLHLIEQKLYYCDYLSWPSTCLDALDEFKRQKGMTPQLVEQYIYYYTKHEKYQALLDVIVRWSDEFDLIEEFFGQRILALSKLGRKEEALGLLRSYMSRRQSAKDLMFASQRYIELDDTLMAAYYMGKLAKMDSLNDFIFDRYPYMLLNLGFDEQAFMIFEKYSVLNPYDFRFHSQLSGYYEEVGKLAEARNALKNFEASDSVLFRMTDLYLAENQWDSAHYYTDKLISRDSTSRDAWLKKAGMYEDRGWLSFSLNYYSHVIYLYPEDTVARQRADLVRRKIAYLQRLKFEENQLPLPEIESKKIINNE
ncbi:MAG: hypothetical protein RIM99_09325 [Cyclobacteriaceae bacterium]